MPGSLESAIVFALVIAPGYMYVRGYALGRAHVTPARDLYVLAEAIVASVVWLALVFLVLHDTFASYGLLPRDDSLLNRHAMEVGRLLLFVVVAPYVLGRITGASLRYIAEQTAKGVNWITVHVRYDLPGFAGRWRWAIRRGARLVGATVIFTPPTAWDRAWTRARAESSVATLHLKDGGMIRGSLASVDLSPLPRQVQLATGEGFDEDGEPLPLASGPHGVYVEGSEIRAVYFEVP